MPLATGQSLSFYEILGPLGAGAMGEVYRAKDTRLDREVAIKVLPEHFAEDEERLRRFEREAKSLASLNHSNVAQIFSVDQVDDTCFLVLELVPGETLEDRIARGALPIDEAVDVCRQIAEGLEAAHEAGVIHRDLKPANVRITPGGKVKVLDFGLAKPTGPNAEVESTTDSVLATEEGRLLGTPTYMAPEQARGKPIDRRVDVWAFGCVLYECLTAARAFEGETLSDVLAAVLHDEPDWTRLPASTPAHVRELIARCLEKDPRNRLRDVGDAGLMLREPARAAALRVAAARGPAGARRLALACGLALVGGIVAGYALWGGARPGKGGSTRLALPQPVGREWTATSRMKACPTFALSPAGGAAVYTSEVRRGPLGAENALVLWRADRAEPEVLSGSLAGPQSMLRSPFFSWDGSWIGFTISTDSTYDLFKASVDGGQREKVCSLPRGMTTAYWASDDTILFGAFAGGIYRVSAAGGTPESITAPAEDEWLHRSPVLLPEGKAMLYVVDYEGPNSGVRLRSLETGMERLLIPGATWAEYVDPTYLVYCKGADLWADTFDPRSHELGGDPVRLDERVATNSIRIPVIGIGRDGSLGYAVSSKVLPRNSLVWVDRTGEVTRTTFPESPYECVVLSHSGERAVIQVGTENGTDLWLGDPARERLERQLTSDFFYRPRWFPDDRSIVTFDTRSGTLARHGIEGAGRPEWGGVYNAPPGDVTADGSHVVISKFARDSSSDLVLVPFAEDPNVEPESMLVAPAHQFGPHLTRDGAWVAFHTRQTGLEPEVFISPIPATGKLHQVSFGGGTWPRWNEAGDELFFRSGDKLMVAEVTTTPELSTGEPRVLFEGLTTLCRVDQGPQFDVQRDGTRVLAIQADPFMPEERDELRIVLGWTAEMRARLAERN